MPASALPPSVLKPRHIWAVAAGNGLEFYDFLVYAFFAGQIGRSFFPGHSNGESLLLVLATFGVGFLTRPLGGVVIGVMGDVKGRKPALILSMSLMGLATIGLALTPSRDAIGSAAPVLAILFRLLQGFALGGEVGPASAWLMEAAPSSRRGLFVSLQFSSQWTAGVAASLVGVALSHAMDAETLAQWGWRIAFLIGGVVVVAGLWLRSQLPETLTQRREEQEEDSAPLQVWRAFASLMALAGGTVVTYMLSYLTVFGGFTLDLSADLAFRATMVCGLCGMLFNPLGGVLSDRLGRKPVMLVSLGLLLVVTLPCFKAMLTAQTPFALLAGTALMTALLALATPAMLTGLLENLPQPGRSGGAGIVYALAISVFGGTTQFVVAGLMDATDSAMAPAWYMAAALVLGLAGAAAMRETAPMKVAISA